MQFDVIHSFDIDDFDDIPKGQSLIYISSKNTIYFLGGTGNDKIYNYSLDNNSWSQLADIKLPFKMNSFGTILTEDEKYIIILAGIESKTAYDKKPKNEIYVLDLTTMVFNE